MHTLLDSLLHPDAAAKLGAGTAVVGVVTTMPGNPFAWIGALTAVSGVTIAALSLAYTVYRDQRDYRERRRDAGATRRPE